jgi:hypothetical protein
MALFPKPHSKHGLTKFRDGRRAHRPQINAAGEHRQVETGAFNPNDRSRLNEHQNVHGYDGGKAPNPKAHGPAPAHGGMFHTADDGSHAQGTSRTASAAALQGFAAEQDPRSPLSGASKKLQPVKITPGMKNRNGLTSDDLHQKLGQAILAEAKRN